MKICIGFLFLSLTTFPLLAQTEEVVEPKTDWRANWYIEAGAGTQLSFAKDADRLVMGRRLTPSFSLILGKLFSPAWGVRLQVQGSRLHGFSTVDGLYLSDPRDDGYIYGRNDGVRNEVTVNPDGSYRYYLRYMNIHADFRFSLLRLLAGENEKRRFDIWPAIGIGYMHLFPYRGTPKNDVLSTNFALQGTFRLSRDFDINLELHSSLLPDQFDGRITGRKYEPTLGVTLGAAYRFKRRGFAKREVVRYIPQEVTRTVRDTVYVTRIVKEVEKAEPRRPFTLGVVSFAINSYLPKKDQEPQLINVVRYLKANPKAKVRLDGYADKETGTTGYNKRLAIHRVSVVRQILMDDYEVPSSRIEAQAMGDNGSPYGKKEYDRAVVMTIVEE